MNPIFQKVIHVIRSPESSVSGQLALFISSLLHQADFFSFVAADSQLHWLASDALHVAWIVFCSELFAKQVDLKIRFQVNARRVFRRRSTELHCNRSLKSIARHIGYHIALIASHQLFFASSYSTFKFGANPSRFDFRTRFSSVFHQNFSIALAALDSPSSN